MIRHPLSRAGALLALLAWAPLPFGSVTPRASAGVSAAALLVAALALVTVSDVRPPRFAVRVALCLAAVAGIGFLQSLSWPSALVARVSPEHAGLAGENAELLSQPPPASAALSLAPGASRRSATLWLAAAAALLSGSLLGHSRRARRGLFAVLLAGALFQVLYGIPHWLARSTTIWGVEVPNQPTRLRGTFVNPNHLATFLILVLPVAFALLWWRLSRRRRAEETDRRFVELAPVVLLWLTLFTVLSLTRSRAGLIAGLAGLVAQLAIVAAARSRAPRGALWGGAAALAAALALVAFADFETGFGRFFRIGGEGDFRLAAMADASGLIGRFPLTGVGLGAFRAAFPLARPMAGEGDWWHAHNDWLELLLTTGILGLAVATWGLWSLARGLRRAWRRGHASEDRAAALAAIGAVVAVGLQEFLDFGLTIPANALALAAICGAALAVPLTKDRTAGRDATAAAESRRGGS